MNVIESRDFFFLGLTTICEKNTFDVMCYYIEQKPHNRLYKL